MAKAKKTTKKAKTSKKTKEVKPTKKSTKASAKSKVSAKPTNQKFYDQLKLNESYISLLLGAIVVVGVTAIFFVFIREARKTDSPKADVIKTTISPVLSKSPEKTHVMSENESLWDVAVNEYGDGFRYTEIIEANKGTIENPDYVPPGTVIVIPQ